jgi:hypothetical protein
VGGKVTIEPAALISIAVSLVTATATSTLYLASRMGRIDTRLSVVEALFKDHCKREPGRRNTGEFPAIIDEEG